MLSDISYNENLAQLDLKPLSWESTRKVYSYRDKQKVYKSCSWSAEREITMMLAAGECSISPLERVVVQYHNEPPHTIGYTMKREVPIMEATIDPTFRDYCVREMISCVQALHRKGIVHGDVKPANMLLCSDKTVRLCDFAEARLLSEDPVVWNDWEGETTVHYTSPNRCQTWPDGRDAPPVIEDDLYALGLSIWEIYTRKVPFEKEYEDDIRKFVKAGYTVDIVEVEDIEMRDKIRELLLCGGVQRFIHPSPDYLEDYVRVERGSHSLSKD